MSVYRVLIRAGCHGVFRDLGVVAVHENPCSRAHGRKQVRRPKDLFGGRLGSLEGALLLFPGSPPGKFPPGPPSP